MSALLVAVHFLDGRYHGGEWPPSPARLFQALVSGAARGDKLPEHAADALAWLERLEAPFIAAPSACTGQSITNYVPNNDLDAVDGDPARIGEIRAAKISRPHLFDAATPLLYAWTFEPGVDAERHARALGVIADNLYQLGRGVDMAWATGEVIDDADARLLADGGVQWRPDRGAGGSLSCPHAGSLASLTTRFEATRRRFTTVKSGGKVSQLFTQAPKPSFVSVPYNSTSVFLLFDVETNDRKKGFVFAPQPVARIAGLTETIRDRAAQRLKESAWCHGDPRRVTLIDRIFVGRDATESDKARRIRIVPLPSIGHPNVDRAVRRILVVVPPDCPIALDDIFRVFSGLPVRLSDDGKIVIERLAPANDRAMLAHYGLPDAAPKPARLWRSVTPAALPPRAARRRIDPGRMREDAKGGAERAREHAAAADAVGQALRHAGVDAPVHAIRVQREPFEAAGQRAEAFAQGARFAKERLWHVEVSFAQAIEGPLLIGDGRYLGLGLMAPSRRSDDVDGVFAFAVTDGLADRAEPAVLARALRRAVMARVQAGMPRKELHGFFTGHAQDGAPLRSGRHEHLAFVFDAPRRRLLVVAPHVFAGREASNAKRDWYLPVLEQALAGLRELRAGPAGKLALVPAVVDRAGDPLFGRATTWTSVTPYRVTRHAKLRDAAAALAADLLAECRRAGLPPPCIDIFDAAGQPGLGLSGRATLTFRAAVPGPLMLGRDRHAGGGLFEAVE